jgi:hypothetical protein
MELRFSGKCDVMRVKNLPFSEIAGRARAFRLDCPPDRKRESQHHVNGCETSRSRLHWSPHPARHTTGEQMSSLLDEKDWRARLELLARVFPDEIRPSRACSTATSAATATARLVEIPFELRATVRPMSISLSSWK